MQRDALTPRFYIEVILGGAALGLFAVTLVWNDWIELVFKVDPDAGNGSLEYFVCFVLLAVTAMSWWFARSEWRRARSSQRVPSL
jgi:hypothetical protein